MLDGERSNFVSALPRGEMIAQLNDRLRKTTRGGRILVTRGVLSLPGFSPTKLLHSLSSYDGFDADNDPHGERDFGDLQLFGAELLWKIDYYDERLEFGSSDPANPLVTSRVLTVMLDTEY